MKVEVAFLGSPSLIVLNGGFCGREARATVDLNRQQSSQCRASLDTSRLCAAVIASLHQPIIINPFTAPACKISGLKDARTRLKNSIFSGLRTNLLKKFSAMCFDENPFTSQCKK